MNGRKIEKAKRDRQKNSMPFVTERTDNSMSSKPKSETSKCRK